MTEPPHKPPRPTVPVLSYEPPRDRAQRERRRPDAATQTIVSLSGIAASVIVGGGSVVFLGWALGVMSTIWAFASAACFYAVAFVVLVQLRVRRPPNDVAKPDTFLDAFYSGLAFVALLALMGTVAAGILACVGRT